MSASDTVYLKIAKNVKLPDGEESSVRLGDIGQIFCTEKSIANKIRTLRLPLKLTDQTAGGQADTSGAVNSVRKIDAENRAAKKSERSGCCVYSILDVMEVIWQEYPKVEINNLGESDFILTRDRTSAGSGVWAWTKTILLCFLAFFGAAFSIMAFNTDVGLTDLFGKLYEMFTGETSNGFTLLEVSYSVGVGLGILIFFHHFSRKKDGSDPTPLQIQMRVYEDEVNTARIETKERKS